MQRRTSADHMFEQLHQLYMPRLYHTAIYLLGNRAEAEDAAGRAFTAAFLELHVADERVFRLKAARQLFALCLRHAQQPYGSDEIVPLQSARAMELLQNLSELDFQERAAVVITCVYGCSMRELAHIQRVPEWAVAARLEGSFGKLCGMRTYAVVSG